MLARAIKTHHPNFAGTCLHWDAHAKVVRWFISFNGDERDRAAGKLSDEDVHEMLSNMELAAPEDSALVQLLSRWAKRGRRPSPEPQVTPTI